MYFILLILLLLGCSNFDSSDPDAAYCTEGMDTQEAHQIDLAIQEWNKSLPKIVSLHKPSKYETCFLKIQGTPEWITDCPNGLYTCSGITYPYHYQDDFRLIKIFTQIDYPKVDRLNSIRIMALHEVGHYLGAEHSENPKDIMHFTLDFYSVNHLTSNDINQVKRYQD